MDKKDAAEHAAIWSMVAKIANARGKALASRATDEGAASPSHYMAAAAWETELVACTLASAYEAASTEENTP